MPIERVPVVHRFGIISHSQRLELQERLLKQSYLETFATRRSALHTRNPLEVTEEFIQQYNVTEDAADREKLDDTAHKMLFRIKRRAGLKDGGTGEHVDLPVAWTELSQLAQCKGKIQEECLDVLITSLDQASLDTCHIPALFFLAETTLYWLRTDAVHQPFLRTGEIKLLRMGQLVFMRLFYHHMAGQLQGHEDFKNRLFTYLDGFAESQEAYSPYPNALLCVRYINQVGKIIIGDCNTEAGEIKEGDNIHVQRSGTRRDTDTGSELFRETSVCYEDTHSSHSAAISSSVHDLSPTLWHALDVWRCVNYLGGGLSDGIRALASCGMGLASESWVDCVTAMHVLGDASKNNLYVLRTLENLARGLKQPANRNHSEPSSPMHNERDFDEDSVNAESVANQSPDRTSHVVGSPHSLSDIFEKPEAAASLAKSHATKHTSSKTNITTPSSQQQPVSSKCSQDSVLKHAEANNREDLSPKIVLQRHTTKESQMSKPETQYTTLPNTAWKVEVGSDLGLEGRTSQASTIITYANLVHTDLPGLHGWHWEVAVSYAEALADICLHGATSNIQKLALVGIRKDVGTMHKTAVCPEYPMQSAGLLDLAFFHANRENHDGSANDWSWRVRYAALQGLVKICRCCATDQTKGGMRNVAWNTLVKAHSLEKDQRVLEALKVGQVESNIENLLSQNVSVSPDTIGAKVAGGLSKLYLPPLPPAVKGGVKTQRHHTTVTVKKQTAQQQPVRTSLKQEIMLATALHERTPSFKTRTSFDLKRIVEDQWRKELQKKVDEEEVQNEKEIDRKAKEDEEKQQLVGEKRLTKLQTKYKGKACQFSKFSKHKEIQELPDDQQTSVGSIICG